ncbi:MAG: alanine/glycine:cation symporter family protein [Pseudomonadales bacterium]
MSITLQDFASRFAELAWGPWLLVLLLGGGAYFLLLSRFVPFRYLGHGLALLRGKYEHSSDPGQISHFQALSAALAGTIGLGNIGGVALAIAIGGPGAIFWMWVTAILGIATKFFTCSLAVMYRHTDANGQTHGGPMYVITEGLGPRWRPLAIMFALFGMIGALPVFQTNQLVQILREVVIVDAVLATTSSNLPRDDLLLGINLGMGVVIAAVTSAVIFGGIARIAKFAVALVPSMSALYLGMTLTCILSNLDEVPAALSLIVTDAFSAKAAAGGGLLSMILYGVQRGAFSNEAGIGTEALAHGAAKTSEPIREGLVAMLGPIIDTLLICTATAIVILLAGNWHNNTVDGITLTAEAFATLLGTAGTVGLLACVVCFALTTIFTYSFYGAQCARFLLGNKAPRYYRMIYVSFVLVAAVISLKTAIGLIDGAYALMAIPTMISTIVLAPKVKQAADRYFASLNRTSVG